jgi:hypothetical protein
MTFRAVQPMVSYFVWRVFDHANAHDFRQDIEAASPTIQTKSKNEIVSANFHHHLVR